MMAQQKEAVGAGYWHLYRYNPELAEKGENPFSLDSKEPGGSFQDFLRSEVRYTALEKTFPEVAQEYFVKAEADSRARHESYKRLAAAYEQEE